MSRRIAIWRLVGTALWIASVFLTSLAANSLLALAAMFAIMIITIPVTLAERDRRLAGWERHVLPAICVGGGLVFLLRIPLRFVAYVMGVPMQEVASSPSIASSLWIDTTFGGVFLVFGIAFWVWATRAKCVTPSNESGFSVK